MNTIKRILLSAESSTDDNIDLLVQAGLFEEKRVGILKRAMNKNPNSLTMAESKILKEFVDNVVSQLIYEKQDHLSKYDKRFSKEKNTEKELPTVIILKRKAIRVYPDDQKVALYYSQALDRYISIPYGNKGEPLGMTMNMNEESLNEISQEVATSAYAKRVAQINADIESGKADSAQAVIKLEKLSKRMKTPVLDPTGRNIRPWAGSDALRIARRASDIETSMQSKQRSEAVKKELEKKKKEAMKPGNRLRSQGLFATYQGMKGGSTAYNVGLGTGLTLRRGAQLAGKALGIKEETSSFRRNLNQIREDSHNELNERRGLGGVGDAIDILKKAPEAISSAGQIARQAGSTVTGSVSRAATSVAGSTRQAATSAKQRYRDAVQRFKEKRQARKDAKQKQKQKDKDIIDPTGLIPGQSDYDRRNRDELDYNVSDRRAEQIPFTPTAGATVGLSSAPRLGTSDVMRDAQLATLAYRDPRAAYMGYNAQLRESNLSTIKNLAKSKKLTEQALFFGESTITINRNTAKKVMKIYESLNNSNKNKMEKMLNESATSFKKAIQFAVRH